MKALQKLTVVFSFAAVSFVLDLFAAVGAQDATPAPLPYWSYEGEDGPANWGSLDPRYAACSTGRAQSPINISGSAIVKLTNITFNYKPSALNIFNNGHSVQVNYDAGSSITYNEDVYNLVQFHFHHPSEHTVDGQSFAMELHLVHSNAAGHLAVVAALLQQGSATNGAYAKIFDHLPTAIGTPDSSPSLTVDASALLPGDHTYSTYLGSLTTPPCTEGVRWLVMKTPVEISAEQVKAFAALYPANNRPIQPLNNRDLFSDSSGM